MLFLVFLVIIVAVSIKVVGPELNIETTKSLPLQAVHRNMMKNRYIEASR